MAENESIIWGLIRNARERKAKRIMLQNINAENDINRRIVRYQPSQIEGFFSPHEPIGNTIISGGTQIIRNRTICSAINSAVYNNSPIIILHIGNKDLEYDVSNQVPNAVVFNNRYSNYDPFIGLSDQEIIRLILSSATEKHEIGSDGQYYLEGITEFIRSKNIAPYAEMYIRCPHLELFDKIEEAEAKGYIYSATAQRIQNLLAQGQKNRSSIENYFNILRHQSQGLLSPKNNLICAKSLRTIIDQNGVAILDIGSITNDLLINLVMEDASGALTNGKNLTVVFDNIPISASKNLERFILNIGTTTHFVFSSSDVYSSLKADDYFFASLVGKAHKLVIYQHSSGISCAKWADTIGYYEKKEVNRQISSGTHRESMFSIIPGQIDNDTITISSKREHRVRPEEINSLTSDEVYIMDSINNEVAFTKII